MSATLHKTSIFIRFLLDYNVSEKQRVLVLAEINDIQIKAISEILLNIHHGYLKISKQKRRAFERKFKQLHHLFSSGKSHKVKQRMIQKQIKFVLNSLKLVKKEILQIIS